MSSPVPSPEQVRAARAWLQLTQDAFAARLGIPKRTLIRLELGETVANAETLARLMEGLQRLGVELIFVEGRAIGITVPSHRRAPRREKRRAAPEQRSD